MITFPNSWVDISPSLSLSKRVKASLRHSRSVVARYLSGLGSSIFVLNNIINGYWLSFKNKGLFMGITDFVSHHIKGHETRKETWNFAWACEHCLWNTCLRFCMPISFQKRINCLSSLFFITSCYFMLCRSQKNDVLTM